MNISMKKLYSIAIAGAMIFGGYMMLPKTQQVNAQACSVGQTGGNLYGYLETDEVGYIYLSTETWNNDPLGEGHATTNEQVSVSYDRQTNRFSGRGWSPYAGWVDFGGINNNNNSVERIATFESVENNPDLWGNWDAEIDLSGVGYSTDEFTDSNGVTWSPGFVGFGTNGGYTYFADGSEDEFVGAGNIDFTEVSIIEPPCTQYVTLTLNGASDVYQEQCPFSGSVRINWASENVTNCVVDSDNWNFSNNYSLPEDEYQTGTNYSYTGTVDDTAPNTPFDTVRIRCIGANGQTVSGSASISCGSTVEPPTTGTVIPTYTEV